MHTTITALFVIPAVMECPDSSIFFINISWLIACSDTRHIAHCELLHAMYASCTYGLYCPPIQFNYLVHVLDMQVSIIIVLQLDNYMSIQYMLMLHKKYLYIIAQFLWGSNIMLTCMFCVAVCKVICLLIHHTKRFLTRTPWCIYGTVLNISNITSSRGKMSFPI